MQEKIDKLNREKYIEFIKNLIINSEQYKRNIDSNSYVIALDSPWGTGKSYFIDLFLQSIRDETSICAVNYNAWKNDYRDNAFEPLIYDILTSDCLQFSVNNNAEKENIKKLANNIVKICAAFGKSYIEKIVEDKTGVKFNAPNNIHSAEDFKNFMLREIPNLTELNSERESFDDFKKYLRNAIQYLKDYKKKLVIIIDELDRCKPTFAIQTLEIVKHLFDIENIVFIFAVLKTKTDYTQNKKINFCLNIYDKQNQLLNKSKRHNSDKNKSKILADVKSSENILRIEYKAYYESIRLLCKKFKISNTLENLFDINIAQHIVINKLKCFFGECDFYSKSIAERKINNKITLDLNVPYEELSVYKRSKRRKILEGNNICPYGFIPEDWNVEVLINPIKLIEMKVRTMI